MVTLQLGFDLLVIGCWLGADMPQIIRDTSANFKGVSLDVCMSAHEIVWWCLLAMTKVRNADN